MARNEGIQSWFKVRIVPILLNEKGVGPNVGRAALMSVGQVK